MGRGRWFEKRLPLKCHSFGKRRNFPRIWFRDLRFRTWGLEINHLNAHNFVWQGCFFLLLLSRKFADRLSSNFYRFVILCICWDTPTVKASLWQLSKLSSAFNAAAVLEQDDYARDALKSETKNQYLHMFYVHSSATSTLWNPTPPQARTEYINPKKKRKGKRVSSQDCHTKQSA